MSVHAQERHILREQLQQAPVRRLDPGPQPPAPLARALARLEARLARLEMCADDPVHVAKG